MDRDERKLTKPLEVIGRYKYALLVALLGAGLLLWPGHAAPASPEQGTSPPAGAMTLRETEEAMEAILERISGVGRADVMLTLQSGSELVLAEDTTLRYRGDVQSPDDYERSSDTVTDSGGVVVTQEKYPQYRGALVVCDGGGVDAVRLQVIEAVSALTGLGADRIAVVKWQGADSGQK